MQCIVLAIDGSPSAEHALEVAIDLARSTNASLEIVAVRPTRLAGRAGSGGPIDELEEPGGVDRVLEAAAEIASAHGQKTTLHALHGDPVGEIRALATTLDADLIVVGSRGLGTVSGALFGSVSQSLATTSSIPVTVVRATVRAIA